MNKAIRVVSNQQNAPFFVENEVIVLTKNGVWLADGIEITHDPTRKLFAKSIHRDQNGYFIQVGREAKRIQVEDTPYFVHRIEGDLDSGIEILLSNDSRQKLDPLTLHYYPGRLTCQIQLPDDTQPSEAKFLHSAYFDLLKHLQEDAQEYFLEFSYGPRPLRIRLSSK